MSRFGDAQRISAEIDAVLEAADQIDDETKASLARYVCILASSYLEVVTKDIVKKFVSLRADENVARFVDSSLQQFRDPNSEKILTLFGRINPEFRKKLEDSLFEREKDSIDSIYANRNNIAHGRRSGISIYQIKKYLNDSKLFMSKVKSIIIP